VVLSKERASVSLSQRAISGVAWMFTSSAGLKAVSLLVNLVLARLLVPSDFGAVALVLGVTGVLQTFAEMGTSVALVQRKDVTASVVDSAFSSTLVVTASIVICLWAFSHPIASFFDLPVMAPLLKIAAISYFFRGLFSLYRCLLLKEMRYKEISILAFFGYVIYGCAAMILAHEGFGPFSLVWGQLVWTVSLFLMGMWRTRYMPKSLGSLEEMWELVRFGVWVSGARVLRNASANFDRLIIGKFLDASSLGVYHIAQRIVMFLPGTYTRVIDQVMLPIYAKRQDDLSRVEEGYWKVLSYTAFILIPPVCLLFVFADPLVPFILGDSWLVVIPVVKIMSLFALGRALGDGIFDSVVYALARPQIVTVMNVFRIIALPACILLGCRWGLIGLAWAFAAYGVIGRLFSQWLLKRYFGFSFGRFFSEIFPPFISALLATGVALGCIFCLRSVAAMSQIFGHGVAAFAWVAVYSGSAHVTAPEKVKEIYETLLDFMSRIKGHSFLRNTRIG